MSPRRLELLLLLILVAVTVMAIGLGESPLSAAQYHRALTHPGSPPGEVLWAIRLPRVVMAALIGAGLGLAGAAMQGLLRNPLAEPGVLGVSAMAGLGASLAIAGGLAALPGAVEISALAGALLAGAAVVGLAARFREPEVLILFGVALSAFAGALTALVFNLSPSPVAMAEVLAWLMGSVENRDFTDIFRALPPMVVGAALCAYSTQGLRMLTLGEEAAQMSGLPMARLRVAAVAGSALLAGAAVAAAGVIGFVGLAAPHLVRAAVRDDPGKILRPSALAGALLLVVADLAARLIPSEQELKLGVVTALFGAPVFALLAWRAARELAVVTAVWTIEGAKARHNGARRGKALVLDGASLSVAPGEVLGVVGPNGAGKTSLLRAGLGLMPLEAGRALLGQRPLAGLNPVERARLVGYLPQERRLAWNLPALDVVALGAPDLPPGEALAVARERLARVGISDLAERGVLDMSGGERARVLLARLLATRAPLLVADEPVAGLDPDAQLLTLDLLRAEAAAGAAVVVTLHDLGLAARSCDRVLVLDHGRVAADAAPMAALSPDVLAAVFRLDGALIETPAGVVVAAKRTLSL